jgi:uncharacterized protein YqeY
MVLENLTQSLKEAMKSKDEFKTSVLRMLISSIHNRQIEKRSLGQELSDQDVFDVMRKEVKKRKEAIEMYKAANRMDLASVEEKELEFIQTFLPAQMSEDEIEKVILEILKEFSNPTQKDFGLIMKKAMAQLASKADGSVVSQVIKKHLSLSE